MSFRKSENALLAIASAVAFCSFTAFSQQPDSTKAPLPWMNTNLSPDQRSSLVLGQLTLDEKILLIHGQGILGLGQPTANTPLGNGGDGFALGVPRLGIPIIQMCGSATGVTFNAENGRYSTGLPSDIAAAASWDSEGACRYGTLIGRELRDQGYNMSLAGGVNIARELRNGRTFEYLGEDPILAGTLVGNRIRCEQAQHVIAELKHYAMNDQESGRNEINSIIDKRAMRETDLLAFEIGNSIGHPEAVMCSYNAVNGEFACENRYLLTNVLKKDWKFPGFVLSDWGGTHSTLKASAAGLDMEQPEDHFYGGSMMQAVLSGSIPSAELDEHVKRILHAEFASGIIDFPVKRRVPDVERGYAISREIAEESIVLLKNTRNLLPLDRGKVRSIAIIGSHADESMISGGGSAQVDPPGNPYHTWKQVVWYPSSPLRAVARMVPGAVVEFNSGADVAAAAALAKRSEVAIVFAHQWMSEGMDLADLGLPDNQHLLIEKVAASNPDTIIVLETGTAVTMPWVEQVGSVLEAWYAGNKGADAVANILFGEVNPSAKLPITFPRSDAALPPPPIAKPTALHGNIYLPKSAPTFSVHYTKGLEVGYKWYDAEHKEVLFPFGFGLSYTTFSYSNFRASHPGKKDGMTTVSFSVRNTGGRAGVEIAEVYAALPIDAGEPPKRLVGWSRVSLNPGEIKEAVVTVDAKYLSVFDEAADAWKLLPGKYVFNVGDSSQNLSLTGSVTMP